MPVQPSQVRPFGDVNALGIVVCRAPRLNPADELPLHSGFLYKLDAGMPRISHLAWHLDLRDEPAADPYMWANVGLDEANSRFVAAWLADRGKNPALIPYGIDGAGASFDPETDEFVPPPVGKGLTCATYIAAVFKHLGFQLLQEDSWPTDRQDDNVWQEHVVKALSKTGASEEHVDAVKNDVGARRFRPAEVTGAATLADWPIAFPSAEAVANSVIENVRAVLGTD